MYEKDKAYLITDTIWDRSYYCYIHNILQSKAFVTYYTKDGYTGRTWIYYPDREYRVEEVPLAIWSLCVMRGAFQEETWKSDKSMS